MYQPIVDLSDGSLKAVEALARFSFEPKRSPDRWFQEAGEVGLLSQLECVAIEGAVSHIASIPGSALLSVNVSPSTMIGPDFAKLIPRLPMERLVLEITEHAYVEDYATLKRVLLDVNTRGGRVAVDDAGAGFASLRHIVQMAPAVIKLDMSLVRGIDSDPARRALVTGLCVFAKEVNATIVAEGIESPNELRVLRALGVSHGQGYYLARPGGLPAPIRYPLAESEQQPMSTGGMHQ